MGAVASCCNRPSKEDINIETNKYYITPKNYNSKRRNFIKKNNYLDINNLIVSEDKEINNNKINEGITEESTYNLEKIKKIQKNYHSHYTHKKFMEELKPSIERKTTNYLNKIYQHCSQGGNISIENDDFSEDGWKRYYPSNERFFLYNKGEVYPNQVRLNNIDNPEKLEIYEGEVNHDNLKHGSGVLTTPYYILKGTWRKGEFTGWGKKYIRNGDVLEGKFVNGELNGKGTFKNKDSLYIGEFVNGKRSGKGDLRTEKYHYKGEFKDNKFDGIGSIEFLTEGHSFEGTFEKNEINGKGIYRWSNGDIYEGEMKNGKMNGKGKYTYIEGKIYEGEYVNGIKEGKGKLMHPDGKCFNGNFKNGVPDGEGLYTENGNTLKVLFSKGKFVKIIT